MKKNLFVLCTLILCILCFSCSNLYQDFTTTTVELTPEFIKMSRNAAADDPSFFIYVCLQCENKTQIKTVDIAEIPEADGVTLQFDKLPVGKTGTLYVSVVSKKIESNDIPRFYSENIAELDGKTQFRVKPNGNTKIKVYLKENEEKFFAEFLTFPCPGNIPVNYIGLDFTEYSTITAPLPIGTTRWQIYFNNMGDISYHGSFGEKIDVKKELIQYKEYFINPETGKNDTVRFEATGNPTNQIKTPIVYSSFDSTSGSNFPYLYNFANSLNEVGENTKLLFNISSEENTDYCFDNAGNLYFIYYGIAHKLAYDFDTNSYESAIIDGEFCYPFYSGISAQRITYDQAQNALYVYGSQTTPDSAPTYIHRIQNPAGAIYKNQKVGTIGDSWSTDPLQETDIDIFGSISFTVHNGILYVSKIQKTAQDDYGTKNYYSLVLQKGSIESGTFEDPIEYKILSDAQNGLSGTTDIMYQDGSLYVIFRCYNIGWDIDNNYSTGGIVKYNIESNSFDESFGIKGFAPNNSTKINSPSTPNIRFYAPTSGETENKYFYGPTKFVAIMPKKLVFLDQGASIDDYDYEQYNTNIPTKSRIVEYDLSTNTFTTKEILSSDLGFNFTGFSM